jgi:DNA-binding FrmR family transcriptional regulator
MLEEDKSYPEIVQQISAVRGALDSVIEVIVQDLVEHYVNQTAADTPARDIALELKETVSNIL